MRTGLLSTVAGLALLTTPTAAQNFDWSGFYVGVHGGYFSGDVEITDGPERITGGIEGPIVGGLAGYNFAHDSLVFGIEGDFGIAHAAGDEIIDICPEPIDCSVELFEYELNWNAHLRGKLGVPLGEEGRIMPFIAGGLALADYDVTENGLMLGSGVTAGFTIGAGVDVRFADNLVGRAEVLYDDYGTRSEDYYSSSLTGVTARASLIWALGP
jgi:opacity protein-like surface antigen